jgi:hypothetical protein
MDIHLRWLEWTPVASVPGSSPRTPVPVPRGLSKETRPPGHAAEGARRHRSAIGVAQLSAAGAAPYSSSVTWAPHVALLPSSSTWSIARWVMKRVDAAPCQ